MAVGAAFPRCPGRGGRGGARAGCRAPQWILAQSCRAAGAGGWRLAAREPWRPRLPAGARFSRSGDPGALGVLARAWPD
eukprot:1682528-Pyramimonas_sp.AAC.1